MTNSIADVRIPDSKLAREVTELDSPEELLALISDAANNDVRPRLRTEIRRRIRKLPVRATVAK
jgi:hypothetical protein